MVKIEIREYMHRGPKGHKAGRRCTFYGVVAATIEEAKAKALRTHSRRIETGDLKAPIHSMGAGETWSVDPISYVIL